MVAALGIGAIAYYKGLSQRDKSFIDDMTAAILKAAQQSVHTTEIDNSAQYMALYKGDAWEIISEEIRNQKNE